MNGGGNELPHEGRRREQFDYTRKRGIAETMILASDAAPKWARDRALLWNQVEAAEIRKDAQLARPGNPQRPAAHESFFRVGACHSGHGL